MVHGGACPCAFLIESRTPLPPHTELGKISLKFPSVRVYTGLIPTWQMPGLIPLSPL